MSTTLDVSWIFAELSMSESGVGKVKVYVDSLIGSLRLAFRATNTTTWRLWRFPDAWTSDAINIDHSRPTGVHPKCAVPGCIDKPIARCDVAAIDGPRAANIVVTIMTTLVTFAYYWNGRCIVISYACGYDVDEYSDGDVSIVHITHDSDTISFEFDVWVQFLIQHLGDNQYNHS